MNPALAFEKHRAEIERVTPERGPALPRRCPDVDPQRIGDIIQDDLPPLNIGMQQILAAPTAKPDPQP